jgi:hypothetical protein
MMADPNAAPQEIDINELLNSVPTAQSSGLDVWAQGNLEEMLKQAKTPEEKQSWQDALQASMRNFPKSAAAQVQGIGQAIMHPLQTAQGLIDIPAGALNKAFPGSIGAMSQASNPEATARANQAFDSLVGSYKEKFGSEEGFKHALANDPVGLLMDLATVVSPVSGGLRKMGVRPLAAAGDLTASGLGMTTGVGKEAVTNAFKAGMEGDPTFMQNLRGQVPMQDALDAAKQGLENIKQKKNAQYRSGIMDITNDKSILDFANIDQALADAQKLSTFKGQIKNQRGYETYQKMKDVVDNWKTLDPANYHTPEGFDALKQALGGIADSIPYEERTATATASQVYNKVKKAINDQAPTYSEVMKNYADASDQIREMEKTLSLKQGFSADTALRKLQSLTRNNVSTNYGQRLDLAKQLEAQGGVPFINALSGQAMQSAMPRGLAQLGGIGALGGAISNPAYLAALPFQSPRLVGTAAYGLGRGAAGAEKALANVPLGPTSGTALINLLPQMYKEQQ